MVLTKEQFEFFKEGNKFNYIDYIYRCLVVRDGEQENIYDELEHGIDGFCVKIQAQKSEIDSVKLKELVHNMDQERTPENEKALELFLAEYISFPNMDFSDMEDAMFLGQFGSYEEYIMNS